MTDKPEAVAWLYQKAGWGDKIIQGRPDRLLLDAGYVATPLYAHPPAQPDAALVDAAKALCDAIVQDQQGGWHIAGDDPEALACNLHSALSAWEAQHG